MSEWNPVRRRWFVERKDYGKIIAIVQTAEDALGFYRYLEPQERPGNYVDTPGMCPSAMMTGNESLSSFYKPEEAQELLDALWAIGMRPTRR